MILSAAEDNNTRASFNRSTSFAFVSLAVSVTTPKCTRSLTARATDAIVFVAFCKTSFSVSAHRAATRRNASDDADIFRLNSTVSATSAALNFVWSAPSRHDSGSAGKCVFPQPVAIESVMRANIAKPNRCVQMLAVSLCIMSTDLNASRHPKFVRYPVWMYLLCTLHAGASLYVHRRHIHHWRSSASGAPGGPSPAPAPGFRRGGRSCGSTNGPGGGRRRRGPEDIAGKRVTRTSTRTLRVLSGRTRAAAE